MKIKTLACNGILAGAPRTPGVTQRDMQRKRKQMVRKRRKSHENYLYLIESHEMQLK